jgi:hypothetical protein
MMQFQLGHTLTFQWSAGRHQLYNMAAQCQSVFVLMIRPQHGRPKEAKKIIKQLTKVARRQFIRTTSKCL